MIRRKYNYCVIYLLTCIVNNKVYIGQTWYPFDIRMGKNGCNYKPCTHLYNAIKKYGTINFTYAILNKTADQEEANRLEEEYIVKYDSRNDLIGYNIRGGGLGGTLSEGTKNKMSVSRTGVRETQETQDRVVAAYQEGKTIKEIKSMFGFGGNGKVYRILKANNIDLLNDFSKWTGRTHSEVTKKKMSQARTDYWDKV